MVFMGEVVNNPTTNGRKITERSVSDIVHIGYWAYSFRLFAGLGVHRVLGQRACLFTHSV